MRVARKQFDTRDDALASGVVWSYGYSNDPKFIEEIKKQLPQDFRQYDLEMFFFLNYAKFPTDIPREEHWWRAAERRWPTIENPDGSLEGQLIRDDWSEKAIKAFADYETINFLGGAGQGKTKTPIAFGITIFDYFYWSPKGARFQFSSVSEQKIKHAAWHMCSRLYVDSNKACSPNISLGLVLGGSMEIRRHWKGAGTQAVIRGVLITNDSRAEQRIDSLTGAHDVLAQLMLTDEAQSSPDALSRAGTNLRTHAKWAWEIRSGNPAQSDDYLGKAAEPDDGWDSVDPMKHDDVPLEWESIKSGKKSFTIRFDNDFSPGMIDPVRYPHRPNQAFRDKEYDTPLKRQSDGFYRFWKGWFVPGATDNTVLRWATIEQMGCHKFANIEPNAVIHNFMSFDSAPESLDRSPLGRFQVIYDKDNRNRPVLNVAQIFTLPKLNPATFDRDARDIILAKAVEWGVASGNMIQDYTNRSGPLSLLQEAGFMSHGMIYSEKASDRPVDPATGRKASELYGDIITEAAYILEALIRYGQVRGLNDATIPNIKDELCSRRTQDTGNLKTKLEQKASRNGSLGFRKRMGFSPDIFDILCQAAWFAREKFGLVPGIDKPMTIRQNKVSSHQKMRGGFQRRY